MSREQGAQIDWFKFFLGASALAGAIWLFTRTSAAKEEKTPAAPPPSPPRTPPLSPSRSYESPDLPGHEVFVPEGSSTMLSSSSSSSSFPAPGPGQIGLRSGRRYRARLQLTGFEKLGSREQIADTFSALGFQNVAVYMNTGELPGGALAWPAPSSDGGARWAEGVWSKSDENLDKPPQVVEVRELQGVA